MHQWFEIMRTAGDLIGFVTAITNLIAAASNGRSRSGRPVDGVRTAAPQGTKLTGDDREGGSPGCADHEVETK